MKSIRLDGLDVYPSKIVCVGRNYVAHINELNNKIPQQPIIFLKPNSSISRNIHSSKIDVIHFEGEITFLINFGEIKGIGFGLDLTKREVQNILKEKGLPWERAKSFDRSAVFSDFVSFAGNIDDLRMELHINGRLAQQAGCELMLNKPRNILSEVKTFLTFENGDLIMSGTPSGVGPIAPGDKFIGRIFENERLLVEGNWEVM